MARGEVSSSWQGKVEREHPGCSAGCWLLAVLTAGGIQRQSAPGDAVQYHVQGCGAEQGWFGESLGEDLES